MTESSAEARVPRVLDEKGPAAPPRKNGELVFDRVWEGRLFGVTMALFRTGAFAWDEFRDRFSSRRSTTGSDAIPTARSIATTSDGSSRSSVS